MCTVLLPPGVNPIAFIKYIILYNSISYQYHLIQILKIKNKKFTNFIAYDISDMQLYFSKFIIDMRSIILNVVQIACIQTSTFVRLNSCVNNDPTTPF
jgi:hypothetical protein